MLPFLPFGRLLLLLLVLLQPSTAPVPCPQFPDTLSKAQTFQAAINKAVSQNSTKSLLSLISGFFIQDTCGGPDGNQETFIRDLLNTTEHGTVEYACDYGEFIAYRLIYNNKTMKYRIGSEATPSRPMLLYFATEQCSNEKNNE